MKALLVPLLLAWPAALFAQGVSLAGQMGGKALLVVDGQPVTLAVGETARGVKLLELKPSEARVLRDGATLLLRAGAAPAAVGGGVSGPGATEIVLTAGPGGHFVANGAINGRSVRFMVDTGATTVGIGQAEAERLGLDFTSGERGFARTANGTIPAWRVMLRSVRLGEVEISQVEATVTASEMPYVLLGNSFLGRFQMQRTNDVMRLELRR